jgi:hypothetical protein
MSPAFKRERLTKLLRVKRAPLEGGILQLAWLVLNRALDLQAQILAIIAPEADLSVVYGGTFVYKGDLRPRVMGRMRKVVGSSVDENRAKSEGRADGDVCRAQNGRVVQKINV